MRKEKDERMREGRDKLNVSWKEIKLLNERDEEREREEKRESQ